jgi:hypothetical protein
MLPRFRHETSTARREAKAMRREGEMNKRKLGSFALCAVLLVLSVSAEAQQPKKIPRIGYLSSGDPASESIRSEAIRLALRELGYIEGQNIAFEVPYAEGRGRGTDDLYRVRSETPTGHWGSASVLISFRQASLRKGLALAARSGGTWIALIRSICMRPQSQIACSARLSERP